MTKLTTLQAQTYEAIKSGTNNCKAIGECLGKKGHSIQKIAVILEQLGLITIAKKGRTLVLTANSTPYKIVPKILRSDIGGDGEARGRINLTGFEVVLTEKQKVELAAYRATKKEKRTEERTHFAKRIGVPKLYLNFYLQLKEA